MVTLVPRILRSQDLLFAGAELLKFSLAFDAESKSQILVCTAIRYVRENEHHDALL